MGDIKNFDLRDLPPSFFEDPFPTYSALQAKAPLHEMPGGGLLVTRYGDCVEVYRDTATYSSNKTREFLPKYGETPLYEHHTTSLVFNDPPLHTRVRKLIMSALSTRALTAMEAQIEALVETLLTDMEAKNRADQDSDFVADFAAAIPIDVIGDLLDIPKQDRTPLRAWSLAILGALEPQLSAEQLTRGNQAVRDFLAYLEHVVADRRANPGDPDKDLLTRLIDGEVDGERLSHTELLHNCIFILNAGHETTTNIIASAAVLFDRFPDQKALLLEDPALIGGAIEECLRYESPNQLGNRAVVREAILGGRRLVPGQFITLCIGAANRDPAVFMDPARFDIKRRPNKHLAFASGPHQCAGMHVARMEAVIAIGALLKHFPGYRLTKPPKRTHRARFRGFDEVRGRLI